MFYNIIAHFVYVAPSMKVYNQSHPHMMNLTMRIGGMPGGSPEWMGCRVPTYMLLCPLMCRRGGHPVMAPPPGGLTCKPVPGSPSYHQLGYYQ